MRKRGQGQSWSLDIVLAFVIFVLIIAIFYTVLSRDTEQRPEKIQLEAKTISNNLDSATGQNSSLSIIDSGKIDSYKLTQLYSDDYLAIKNKFGIKGDFCIYIVDQHDNIIAVETPAGQKIGFGNGNLTINGVKCNDIIG